MYPQTTYLIQRLKAPIGHAVQPFSFGAQHNGKLSQQEIESLSPIWTFDYMGSAQFELGAIPEALDLMRKYSSEGNAVTNTLQFQKPVSYICNKALESYVIGTITQLAKDESKIRLKEMCLLEANLSGRDYAQSIHGWLELNNFFAFFVDQEMYKKTLALFNLESIK